MKSKYKITTIFLVIISMSFFSFQFAAADGEDYDIEIEEDMHIIWECTDHNVDLFNELKAEWNYVAYHDFELGEGDKMKFEIDTITEYDDDGEYDVEIHYFDDYDEDDEEESTGGTTDYGVYDSFYVAMDPVKLAADWTDGDGYEYILEIICSDTEDYLAEFYANLEVDDRDSFSIYGSTITINQTVGAGSYQGILTYDEDGILEEYSIIYNGVLVYKMELDDVITSEELNDPEFFTLIAIIVIIILLVGIIIVVIVVVLVSAKKKKSKSGIIFPVPAPKKDSQIPQTKTPEDQGPPETQMDVVVVERFCELCGSELDRDAKFCFSCGNKTE